MICDNARPCNTPPGAPLPASPPPAFARAWRLSAILVLGFASGLPLALTGQAMQAWLTVDGVDLATIGFFGLVGIPYTFKFLWAPLMDRFDLPWLGRRRGWLVLTCGGRDYMLSEGGIHGDMTQILKPVLQGTLAYTGLSVLPPFTGYHIPYLSPEKRAEILADFRARLAALDSVEPLAMPVLANYDREMKPLV